MISEYLILWSIHRKALRIVESLFKDANEAFKQTVLEKEKDEISNVAKNLVRFFEENPKQKEVFDKWNK